MVFIETLNAHSWRSAQQLIGASSTVLSDLLLVLREWPQSQGT